MRWGLRGALVLTSNAALRVPAALGVNLTVMLQEPPAVTTDDEHVSAVLAKSPD